MPGWSNGQRKNIRKVFKFMPKPNKKDPVNQLERKDQVIIFRLRSEHIQLNQHLNMIRVRNNANCPLCPCTEESVAHHLYDCPALGDLRAEYLPLNPDPQNTLYGEGEQLKLTCKYHVMANGRRAQAHWPLDQLNKINSYVHMFTVVIMYSYYFLRLIW